MYSECSHYDFSVNLIGSSGTLQVHLLVVTTEHFFHFLFSHFLFFLSPFLSFFFFWGGVVKLRIEPRNLSTLRIYVLYHQAIPSSQLFHFQSELSHVKTYLLCTCLSYFYYSYYSFTYVCMCTCVSVCGFPPCGS